MGAAASRVVRAVLSVVVVVAATGFLIFFGPRGAVLHADIYGPLFAAAGFLPAPAGGGPAMQMGRALVNGQTFHYAIGHSMRRLDDVLDHYERQFTARAADGRPLGAAGRIRKPGAGAVSGFLIGSPDAPDIPARVQRFAETRRLRDFADFHVVTAYEDRGTTFIELTPGEDATLDGLFASGEEDAPGGDVGGLRRPDGLQRLMSIEHGEGVTWSRTVIYRSRRDGQALDALSSAFAGAGWKSNPFIQSSQVFHFTDGQRECFVGGEGVGKDSLAIVVYRLLSPTQGSR